MVVLLYVTGKNNPLGRYCRESEISIIRIILTLYRIATYFNTSVRMQPVLRFNEGLRCRSINIQVAHADVIYLCKILACWPEDDVNVGGNMLPYRALKI